MSILGDWASRSKWGGKLSQVCLGLMAPGSTAAISEMNIPKPNLF
jgi:hypothetical protein